MKKKEIKIRSCHVSDLDWLRDEYLRPFLSVPISDLEKGW